MKTLLLLLALALSLLWGGWQWLLAHDTLAARSNSDFAYSLARQSCVTEAMVIATAEQAGFDWWRFEFPADGVFDADLDDTEFASGLYVAILPRFVFDKNPGNQFLFDGNGCWAVPE